MVADIERPLNSKSLDPPLFLLINSSSLLTMLEAKGWWSEDYSSSAKGVLGQVETLKNQQKKH